MKNIVKVYYDKEQMHLKEMYEVNGLGQKDGSYLSFHKNGKSHMRGYFKEDMKHGWFDVRDMNGKRAEIAQYKNGRLHGEFSSYKGGELVVSGQYVDGQKDGAWKIYAPEGSVLQEYVIIGGKLAAVKVDGKKANKNEGLKEAPKCKEKEIQNSEKAAKEKPNSTDIYKRMRRPGLNR